MRVVLSRLGPPFDKALLFAQAAGAFFPDLVFAAAHRFGVDQLRERGPDHVQAALLDTQAQVDIGVQITVLVAHEGMGRVLTQIEVHTTDSQAHRGNAPGGRVGLLAIDGYVAELTAVSFDEFVRLREPAIGAAARIVDLAMLRVKHGAQGFDDARRGVELLTLLPSVLAIGRGSIRRPGRGDHGPHWRLTKNIAQQTTLFALSNLWIVRKRLLNAGEVRL